MTSPYVILRVEEEEWAEVILEAQKQTLGAKCPSPLNDDYIWWIAFVGKTDEVAGFAGMRVSRGWKDTGYLGRCGVIAAHRGHGLQRRFIRVRERAARKLGFEWMLADTSGSAESGNNLIRCGYRIYQPRKPYGFKHTIYWRRQLGSGKRMKRTTAAKEVVP
jgi:hypothetical protein